MLRSVDTRAVGARRKWNLPDHLAVAQVCKEPEFVLNDLAADLTAAVLACDELRCRLDALSPQLGIDVVTLEVVVRERIFTRAMKDVAAGLRDEIDAHTALRRVGAVRARLHSRLFDRVEVVVRAAGARLARGGEHALEQRPHFAA